MLTVFLELPVNFAVEVVPISQIGIKPGAIGFSSPLTAWKYLPGCTSPWHPGLCSLGQIAETQRNVSHFERRRSTRIAGWPTVLTSPQRQTLNLPGEKLVHVCRDDDAQNILVLEQFLPTTGPELSLAIRWKSRKNESRATPKNAYLVLECRLHHLPLQEQRLDGPCKFLAVPSLYCHLSATSVGAWCLEIAGETKLCSPVVNSAWDPVPPILARRTAML